MATSLKVCHNRRIQQHKVFKHLAARGKTSVDWFFGFKLHLVVNDKGELQGLHLDSRKHRRSDTCTQTVATAIW
ncbi:transposase [Trichocoleus sp. ST-U2]